MRRAATKAIVGNARAPPHGCILGDRRACPAAQRDAREVHGGKTRDCVSKHVRQQKRYKRVLVSAPAPICFLCPLCTIAYQRCQPAIAQTSAGCCTAPDHARAARTWMPQQPTRVWIATSHLPSRGPSPAGWTHCDRNGGHLCPKQTLRANIAIGQESSQGPQR